MKIWLVDERRDAPAATSRTKGIHPPLHGSFFTIVILNINTICHQRGAGLNKTILCFAIGCVHAHTHTKQKAKKKEKNCTWAERTLDFCACLNMGINTHTTESKEIKLGGT